MKKIYFVLLLTIFLGFVAGNKASGQGVCQNCPQQYPFCYTLTIPESVCPSLEPNTVTFCYDIEYCPNRIDIFVLELEIRLECYNDFWDWFLNWIGNNIASLCGYKPCDEPPPMEIYYTVPICGRVEWYGSHRKLVYRYGQGDCDKRCVSKVLWCINGNQNYWFFVSKTVIGTGDCPEINYMDLFSTDPASQYYQWGIDWTRIIGVNCEME